MKNVLTHHRKNQGMNWSHKTFIDLLHRYRISLCNKLDKKKLSVIPRQKRIAQTFICLPGGPQSPLTALLSSGLRGGWWNLASWSFTSMQHKLGFINMPLWCTQLAAKSLYSAVWLFYRRMQNLLAKMIIWPEVRQHFLLPSFPVRHIL